VCAPAEPPGRTLRHLCAAFRHHSVARGVFDTACVAATRPNAGDRIPLRRAGMGRRRAPFFWARRAGAIWAAPVFPLPGRLMTQVLARWAFGYCRSISFGHPPLGRHRGEQGAVMRELLVLRHPGGMGGKEGIARWNVSNRWGDGQADQGSLPIRWELRTSAQIILRNFQRFKPYP
jgi:hypothetical protein